MRGFLGGVSVGALLAAGGLAMWSLSVPMQPPAPEPSNEAAEDGVQAAVQPEQVDPGAAPQMPNGGEEASAAPGSDPGIDADLVEAQPYAPETSNGSDDLSALASADTDPARKPDVGLETAGAGSDGPVRAEAPGLVQAGSESQPASQQPLVPEAPGAEDAIVAATEPAAAPEEPAETASAEIAAGTDESEPQVPLQEQAEAPGTASALVPDIGSAPQATTLPVIGTVPALPAAADGDGAEGAEDIAAADEPEAAADAGQEEALAPQIGTPVVPLTERDKPGNATPSPAGLAESRPFADFAEPFANPDGRPLMSIVLIDDAGAVGAEALAEFPYPLSFAIDPEDPEAATKMAARRSAGFEVLLLADLPRSASPQDAETALEVWRGKLPEAVAILEGVESGVQGNRPLADQVSAVAASAGFGLVTQNSGLNTVQKLALRDGVPAGVVFRDFDGAGQNPRAIRRFLDQAAFRAGQEGAVIMLGRLRPDTISALLIWGLQDRASRVALAPVSASLEAKLPK
ncbi:polysaccharide deacteylase family 2 protein [Leisingera sp. ANG-Vp]|uniref:polysaccharide deacteylase family 2 protein n=1 Tax=Leisingera sp. ANG-Vp TaxID=1577896 RepID=UPI00057D90D8|nr:polysaccharide deacteylase family 2 protein [Leisingera sp. ANG-Vp]KIC22568.1 polysaccharide deacetylase [Leisingera sp. ANG-Vp]